MPASCAQAMLTMDCGDTEHHQNQEGYSASFDNLALTSAFQPIFSIAHRKPVGYEGLLRAYDSNGFYVSPLQVMQRPQSSREHLTLDRRCRLLHAQNFAMQQAEDCWLFLNLNSQCLVTERPDTGFMHDLMTQTGIPAQRIVIEILESDIDDRAYLRELIAHFRKLGCLIAIDDFGAGHSNFDRIWELQPDVVKIDRNLIKQAGRSARVERILSGIVSLLHEAGSLVVIEGVETEKEAMIAISSNADMVQGFYFARPLGHLQSDQRFSDMLDELLRWQQNTRSQHKQLMQSHLAVFQHRYDAEIEAFHQQRSYEECCRNLFTDDHVIRCYLLDEQGYQIGKSLYSPRYSARMDSRFAPLLAGENANWSHRHYHYRALQNPGETQISSPYLSVAGSHMCVTVSQLVEVQGQRCVFCCDLDWQDEQWVA